MSEPIVYVDHSEIREGKLDELKMAMKELAKFVEANEPQLLAYNVYFSGDRARMTVVHVHSDAAPLDFHMRVAGPLFPKFSDFIKRIPGSTKTGSTATDRLDPAPWKCPSCSGYWLRSS